MIKSSFRLLILFLLLIGVILVSNLITYNTQQNKITDLKLSNINLNNQLNLLKKESVACSSNTNCQISEFTSLKGVNAYIYSPLKNSSISNPIAIIGKIPGDWSFEASFPIKLLNQNSQQIASTQGHLLGEWTTTSLVPFSAEITFSGSYSGLASIVLQKDNPSGLANNDDSITIQVYF